MESLQGRVGSEFLVAEHGYMGDDTVYRSAERLPISTHAHGL